MSCAGNVVFMTAVLAIVAIETRANDAEFNNAAAYVEAGDPAKGAAAFEALLDPSLESWKRQRITYDIGTAYLHAGEWSEALVRLQPLASTGSVSPLLMQRLTQNIALSRLMQAETAWNAIQTSGEVNYEAYFSLLVLLKQVIDDIEKGRSSWCALAAVEGSASCPVPAALEAMESEARRLYALSLEAFDSYRLSHSSFQTGVAELLAAEKSFAEEISLLKETEGDLEWREAFLTDLVKQSASWVPLWDRMRQSFDEISSIPRTDRTRQSALLAQAENAFSKALSSLGEREFDEAYQQTNASQKALSDLLQTLFSPTNLADSVARLLINYRLALIKDPIQHASLTAVEEVQNALIKVIQSSSDKESIQLIEKARHYLEAGTEAYKAARWVNARMYVQAAMSFVEVLDQRLSPEGKFDARTTLESAIAKQEFARRMNLLRRQASLDDPELREIDGMIADLQKGVLLAAGLFPNAAMAQQRRIFNDPGIAQDKCQCHPWDDVVPLYDEGYEKARQALALLGGGKDPAYTERLQTQAVDLWNQALAALKNKRPQEKEMEKNATETSEQPPGGSEELNSVLRYVQEMENDDHSRAGTSGLNGRGGAARPW